MKAFLLGTGLFAFLLFSIYMTTPGAEGLAVGQCYLANSRSNIFDAGPSKITKVMRYGVFFWHPYEVIDATHAPITYYDTITNFLLTNTRCDCYDDK